MESGDREKFLQAYDAYSDALFRHCYFRLHDRERAKDLVQEAFCRTWTSLADGEKIKNLRAFLYRILNNLIIDDVRKKKPLSLDEMIEAGFAPKDETTPDLAQQLFDKEVVKILDLLDDSYRTIVSMRYIDELSPREIAKALGLNVNVVSVRIHRGVRKLRQLLEQTAE
ncbi:MAG: RNA polymerase sigma factor [Parcubacteria group bacterium]|nr:RNA polymerase sigma factor [Parcubacteria group bacterium]